jgi:hypothetical protein
VSTPIRTFGVGGQVGADKTTRVNKPPQLNDYMVQNVILLFQNVPEVKIDELDHSEWAS